MSEQIPITRSNISLPPATDESQRRSYPTEFIDLPSEGYFYSEGNPLHSGRVEMKFMTAKEEDILTSQNLIKKGIALNELMKSLIVNPDVKLDDFILGDQNAIFLAARRLAYGDRYKVTIKCPKCEAESHVEVDLSKMKARPFDFSKHTKGNNNFQLTLSVSKKTITYKLLTVKDDADIDAELKALAKMSKGAAPEITTRLKYMITSVDGQTDRTLIKNFVDNMPARDSLEFRRHVRENTPDIDISFEFTCPECGHTERMAMPMGVDFFWPDSER